MLQSGGDAGVDEPVSVLKLQTAKDAGIYKDIQADVLAQPFGQPISHAVGGATPAMSRIGIGSAPSKSTNPEADKR